MLIPSAVLKKSGDGSLHDTVSSCVFDLDATLAASYGGSGQTWANICAAPADGSGQTAYDMYRGVDNTATTDDPTFNGSAGSSAAYWSVDAGDMFTIAAGNTAFLKNLHKTTGGNSWWMAMTIQTPSSISSGAFCGTGATSTAHGIFPLINNASGDLALTLQNGSAHTVTLQANALATTSHDYLVIITYNPTTQAATCWVNSRTSTGSGSLATNTDTTDATSHFQIGSRGNSAVNMPNGTRIYSCAMGNAVLDNAGAAAIADVLNARHGRTYA